MHGNDCRAEEEEPDGTGPPALGVGLDAGEDTGVHGARHVAAIGTSTEHVEEVVVSRHDGGT